MKEFIVHIGHGKTGTTAIQNQLYFARDALEKEGVIYPEIGIPPNVGPVNQTAHHWLCNNLNAVCDDASIQAVRSRLIQLRDSIEKKAFSRVIVSSEQLCYANPKVPEVFREVFFDYKFTIVYFVRRQDELIKSAYLQVVKQGSDKTKMWGNTKNLSEFFEWGWRGFLLCDLVDRWAKVFGDDAIKTVIYHKSLVKDSFDSFKKIIGLELASGVIVDERPNSRVLVEFLNLINIIDEEKLSFDVRWKLVHELEKLSEKFVGQSAGVPLPENWSELLNKRFRDNNISLSQRFMGGGNLSYLTFESDIPILCDGGLHA